MEQSKLRSPPKTMSLKSTSIDWEHFLEIPSKRGHGMLVPSCSFFIWVVIISTTCILVHITYSLFVSSVEEAKISNSEQHEKSKNKREKQNKEKLEEGRA